jgi:ribosome-associated protein
MSQNEHLAKVEATVAAALDRKAEGIVALDVHGLTSYTDTFVIATASSSRQARAIADSITASARERGESALGVEGYDEGRWVLIDLGNIIVHIFQDELRRIYDLERLWSDAPTLDVSARDERTAVS